MKVITTPGYWRLFDCALVSGDERVLVKAPGLREVSVYRGAVDEEARGRFAVADVKVLIDRYYLMSLVLHKR